MAMDYRLWICIGVVVPIVALLLPYLDCVSIGIFFVATVASVTLGASMAIVCCILLSHKHRSKPKLPPEANSLQRLIMKQEEYEKMRSSSKPAVVFTRSIDAALQELMDLVLRDYISSWLKDLTLHHEKLTQLIRNDLWVMLKNVQERLCRIDYVKFITTDVMNHATQHFEKIRFAQVAAAESKGKQFPVFYLSPHLCSPQGETEYLRKLSELLIVVFFPSPYAHCQPLKKLLKEILTCSILQPAIDMLCDPDYLNTKLLHYIQQHQAAAALHQRTYTYAASYEDFIHMIQDCTSLDDLKHIRYNIMTEIMQATTISNLKRAKGLDPDKETIPQGTGKGDLLQARNLKRYINQLTYAKSQCEKRLKALGWMGYSVEARSSKDLMPGKKVLSFHVIMESAFTRRYLYRYLEGKGLQALLGFWAAVEELHHADRKLWHQLGAEIFYTYIHTPSNGIKVDKGILKRMGSFLTGDKGPDVFYEVQEDVCKTIENQHYPSFLVSDVYHKMLTDAEEIGIDFMQPGSAEEASLEQSGTESGLENNLQLVDHSNFARRKLDQIDEKLVNKSQALQALQSSLKADSKILSVLEKEVDCLKEERRQLELHIERTEAWGEFLGQWKARIHAIEIPDEKEPPHIVVMIYLPGGKSSPPIEANVATEWQVVRKLSDFQDLHRKLGQLGSSVKSLDLPSQIGKSLFSKGSDKAAIEKAKLQLQKYLDVVLQDDRLNKSEAVYAFLSPSPEHLKQPIPSPKKSKFSFTTLFRSSASSEIKDGSKDSDDEDSLLLDEVDSGKEDRKDSIAEPLYALISEVFDQRGVFKWLRKTLITFVQITYGRTINRQLRETVDWLFSESMIIYYIHLFVKSWWPSGELASPAPPRSDEQKLRTRCEAREQVLNNIPEVLANLVGKQNASRGASKVFECLQESRLNKQLFYNMLESFVYELCPELKRHGESKVN